jgi:glucosamine-6-phosphate deaminase
MRKDFFVGSLKVSRFDTRTEMGEVGAKEAAEIIRRVYTEKGRTNIIFASSPSQLDVLTALLKEDVDWQRVNAFHMDEYIGLGIEHKASFANYIRDNFLIKARPGKVFYLNGIAPDPAEECKRYGELLQKYPTDITFAGIGENGHMAFNDPGIADFFEKDLVKINPSLDAVCRQQQINDGWFKSLEEVPDRALTVTFYALLRAEHLLVTVPAKSKSAIVKACLEGPICFEAPSSIIRVHRNARLFIDKDSAAGLTGY